MVRMTLSALLLSLPLAGQGLAADTTDEDIMQSFTFHSIDGGEIGFADWSGHPVLVANTASLCGATGQYGDLQRLYDTYKDQGLIVLAIPSSDFRQELADDDAVKDFCEMTFGLNLPMSGITQVVGASAHPFYQWLSEAHGFEPNWNFNKVLIGADGSVLGTWRTATNPTGPEITAAVEGALGL